MLPSYLSESSQPTKLLFSADIFTIQVRKFLVTYEHDSYSPLGLLVPVHVYDVSCMDDHPHPIGVQQEHHLTENRQQSNFSVNWWLKLNCAGKKKQHGIFGTGNTSESLYTTSFFLLNKPLSWRIERVISYNLDSFENITDVPTPLVLISESS